LYWCPKCWISNIWCWSLCILFFPFLSLVSWRHSERSNPRWCAASHTMGRWINSGWKVNVICSYQALIPSLCGRSLLVKVIAGQEIPLTFMKLRVHYGVYKNRSLYLVLNLCKLFVIFVFVPCISNIKILLLKSN